MKLRMVRLHVRQSIANRCSANVSNHIAAQPQLLQCIVLAVNETKIHLDEPHYQHKQSGGANNFFFVQNTIK